MAVHLPDDGARRLVAVAAAHRVSVDEFAAAVFIDNVPEVTRPPERRYLAFVGIGASEQGTSHRVEALLDDGFGGV